MNVRIIIGARDAYACITTPEISLDYRLDHGKGAAASLNNSAQELRHKAKALLARAYLLEEAAKLV